MLPTRTQLEQWFRAFNSRYFEGLLPLPRLVLSKSRHRLGVMACRSTCGWRGRHITGVTIRISIYYDCDERTYQTVLLHEMIHYYIAFRSIPDRSAHGPVFRAHMQRLNAQGWHITVSTDTRSWPVRTSMEQPRTRLLLGMVTNRGQHYLSVVAQPYALRIERAASHTPAVVRHQWYTSTDSCFARYPAVRTLRARKLSDAEWEALRPLLQPVSLPADPAQATP